MPPADGGADAIGEGAGLKLKLPESERERSWYRQLTMRLVRARLRRA